MNNPAKILDIDTVRAFVLVADLGSFTRAAEALDTAQATVSLKLKRLEGLLGHRLLERTPRHVALSGDGERFLPAARNLLDAHQRALAGVRTAPPSRLTLGISDHVAGAELPTLLARLNAYDPTLVVEVRVSSSRDVIARYGQGELDAAIARRGEEGADGETLFREPFGWFAAPSFVYRTGEPLRLATLAAPCGIRTLAIDALDEAGLPWTEAFVGGGVLALGASVSAGLAVATLAHRVAPTGAIEVGEAFGLPRLPAQDVVLMARPARREARDVLKVLAAAFRGAAAR